MTTKPAEKKETKTAAETEISPLPPLSKVISDALERIDELIVGPLVDRLQELGEYRVLVSPDHPTPCSTKKHSHGMVPLAIAGSGIEADGATAYSEREAAATGLRFERGWDLMDRFVKG